MYTSLKKDELCCSKTMEEWRWLDDVKLKMSVQKKNYIYYIFKYMHVSG